MVNITLNYLQIGFMRKDKSHQNSPLSNALSYLLLAYLEGGFVLHVKITLTVETQISVTVKEMLPEEFCRAGGDAPVSS